MGGRVYKNSPDLHGKISDNTLLICVSVNGFIWPSSMNNCITLIGANILLIKKSQKSFTQLIGPRQHICHWKWRRQQLCSCKHVESTCLHRDAQSCLGYTIFIWQHFCQSIWMPESSQFYFHARRSEELENTAHRRSWDSPGSVHCHRPSIYN